ncbi:uncharacterized protein UHO2_05590 [Ustilago hordei]|uniref:uncharacterized protein n=1 Tax=Ustilago hordei TaxID=120017 RepID=UPI001A5C2240|nr:uncharacterized protein UHO2_05590 [Ustilago hordei]SYW76873.1 related to Gag-pol polyprotein [Ustilago hordei]
MSQEPLTMHSDANWVSDATIQRRSTLGSVALVYRNPVAWKSATQKCVSLSAIKAEFIAATEATCEVLFLKQLLCSIGIATGTPMVYSDNTGCIQVSKDPAQHWKLKHIDTKYHFIHNNIQEGRVQIKYEIHVKKPFEVKDDLWYSGGRLVIPKVIMPGRTNNRHSRSAKEVDGQSLSVEHLRFMVMTQCHDGITAGHVGRDATIKAAQRHYWWPNMTAWIADYVASCPVCARYKAPRHRPYGLLQPLATPDRPWGSISLDFIEGLPPSKKYDSKTYDSILVIVDRLTKFAILAPTHKTVMAKQTAVLLYGHMVRLFGYPDHMVSDRGRQFISGAWKAFAEQMGVKHSLSMAYHPQTDGQTERVNQVIEQYLRMYCNYEQNDWANLLDTAAFVYNNTVHNSIGVSPFFACYGWNPKAHPDIPQRLGVNDPGHFEYLMDGKECCKYLQEQIREAQRRSVNQYNRKHKDIEFKVGDMVYINCRNWKTRRPTPKLDTRFAGPYPVQERPARTSSLPQRAEQPTIPSLPDEDLDFEVEALINKHSHNGTTEYKVLWRGYSEKAASWEPVENLNCPDLIQEYEVSEGGRVSRQSRERRREQEE